MPVRSGDTVSVHYRGTLADGTLFDSSEGRDPLTFTLGTGDVIPGFENGIIGLEPGGSVTITIEPEDAYGPRVPELTHQVTVDDFAEAPYVGGMVTLLSPEGDEMPGRIVAIEGEAVMLDFNHPLAGETLIFDIDLVDVKPA